MNTNTEREYNQSVGNAMPREVRRSSIGFRTDWRCPNCSGTDFKKVSLAYQEGLSHLSAKSRLRALLFGEGGPNVVVGTGVTRGTRQTELSRLLRPPKKWSYGKLLVWTGIVSFISLIFYIHYVMLSSSEVSGLPVVVFGVIGLGALLVLVLVVGRHNLLVYPRQSAEWDRSLVCQRCGTIVGD